MPAPGSSGSCHSVSASTACMSRGRARARSPIDGPRHDRVDGRLVELEFDPVQGEVGLGFGKRRALGLEEDRSQVVCAKRIERTDGREPAHELFAEPIADKVLGRQIFGDDPPGSVLPPSPRGAEAKARPFLQASLGDPLDAFEGTGRDDEQAPRVEAIGRVVPLNRHVRSVEEREQIHLRTVAADVETKNIVVALELVDFIEQDDPALGTLDVTPSRLQELGQDVFGLLADVATLHQCRRGDVHERDPEEPPRALIKSVLPTPVGPISSTRPGRGGTPLSVAADSSRKWRYNAAATARVALVWPTTCRPASAII